MWQCLQRHKVKKGEKCNHPTPLNYQNINKLSNLHVQTPGLSAPKRMLLKHLRYNSWLHSFLRTRVHIYIIWFSQTDIDANMDSYTCDFIFVVSIYIKVHNHSRMGSCHSYDTCKSALFPDFRRDSWHNLLTKRVLKDYRWSICHLISVVKSAALKKSCYLQVPGSILAKNTSTQIHMDLSKDTLMQGF